MSAFDFAPEWQIDELISFGGSVAVYAATHARGRRGALKVALGRKRQSEERFCREVTLADAASAAGCPALLGYGAMEEARYVIFELVEGDTLETHAAGRDGRFDLSTALLVSLRLARAVERVHDLGIVHRALQPSNVLITKYGDIKVIDFSRAVRSDMTCDNDDSNTRGFIAPEQWSGDADPLDQRGDVFALGAILFWMLTGTGAPVERLSTGLELALPLDDLAHLPLAVIDFIDEALAREPHRRTRDASAFRRRVETLHRQSAGLTMVEDETEDAC